MRSERIGIVVDENPDPDGRGEDRRQEVPQANARNQQQDAAHGRQHQRIADIRFLEDQPHRQADQQARNENPPFPLRHLPLEMFAIPGQRDDQRELGELRRLEMQCRQT